MNQPIHSEVTNELVSRKRMENRKKLSTLFCSASHILYCSHRMYYSWWCWLCDDENWNGVYIGLKIIISIAVRRFKLDSSLPLSWCLYDAWEITSIPVYRNLAELLPNQSLAKSGTLPSTHFTWLPRLIEKHILEVNFTKRWTLNSANTESTGTANSSHGLLHEINSHDTTFSNLIDRSRETCLRQRHPI
jgi:hypothetical protein